MKIFESYVKSFNNLRVYPFFDTSSDYMIEFHSLNYFLDSHSSSYSEEINSSFFVDRETEINNLFNSYPFNQSELIPADFDSYTFEQLESYRKFKMIELIEPYVLFSLKSWIQDYLEDLYIFLFTNFGDKDYIFPVGSSYYSLKQKSFITYNEQNYLTFELLKCKIYRVKLNDNNSLDSNNYEKVYYDYICYIDFVQFFNYLGVTTGNLPILELPTFTDEQLSIMPSTFNDMLFNTVNNYSPFKTNSNKFGDSYINPFSHIFENTIGLDTYNRSYIKSFTHSTVVETQNNINVDETEFNSLTTFVPNFSRFYNAFNPFEFFYMRLLERNNTYYVAPKPFGGTQEKLANQSLKYKVYRIRLKGYDQYADKFNGSINFDFLPDTTEPIIKKCCLFDLFNKTNPNNI